jgi:hypothetical protein
MPLFSRGPQEQLCFRGGKTPIILHKFIGFGVLLVKTRFEVKNQVLFVRVIAVIRNPFQPHRIFIDRFQVW